MAIKINNSFFKIRDLSFKSTYPPPGTGLIFRISGLSTISGSLTYTTINYNSTTSSLINTGSVPEYVCVLSGSLTDSVINDVTEIDSLLAVINTFITASEVGTTPFTESIISTPGAGNWTKPTGVTQVIVECWGGGGAGGGATINDEAGSGGAGAQYARKLIIYSSPSEVIPYTISSTTTGGTGNGLTGGDTTWNTDVVVAKGGGGGFANAISTGLFATGSIQNGIGDIVYGDFSNDGGNAFSDRGGGSVYGVGGRGAGSTGGVLLGDFSTPEFGGNASDFRTTGTGQGNGFNGSNYGGGGSGALKTGGSNKTGGNGAQGLIRILYR